MGKTDFPISSYQYSENREVKEDGTIIQKDGTIAGD
jgi:hypothetical protein